MCIAKTTLLVWTLNKNNTSQGASLCFCRHQSMFVCTWKGVMHVGTGWTEGTVTLLRPSSMMMLFTCTLQYRDCHCTADNSVVGWQQSCWSSCTFVFKLTTKQNYEQNYEIRKEKSNVRGVKLNMAAISFLHKFRLPVINSSTLKNFKPQESWWNVHDLCNFV